ncbi:hypothetical protein Tco_0598224 [Tanacetum coccineum]
MGLVKTELEKVKEEKEGFEFKLAKFEKSSKDLEDLLASQVTDKSKRGFGYTAVPSPHPLILNRPTPLDLSYSGLEEFKQPEVNGYGPRDSSLKPTTVCDRESNNSKENTDDSLTQQPKTVTETSSVVSPFKVDKDWKEKFFHPANHVRVEEPKKARNNTDAPIIEDWVSDDEEEVESITKVEKKTDVPTATKKESVNTVKPSRRSVRYAEMYRSQRPRGNQRSWNAEKENLVDKRLKLPEVTWTEFKNHVMDEFLRNQNRVLDKLASLMAKVDEVSYDGNTASLQVNTGSRVISTVAPEVNTATSEGLIGPIPTTEDTQEEDQGIDLGNISPSYAISSTPHTRIHKDHPIDHVIEEPKRVSKALSEAMQEELLQFKLQNVWVLVDLPKMSILWENSPSFGVVRSTKKEGHLSSQDKYVHDILRKFNYSDVKSASTPTDLEKPLVKDGDADDVDEHLYRSMIGSLMYLTASRPDIMFAVCACARFQVSPKTSHLLAVKRIFRYLKGKPSLGLWYSKDSPLELVAYTDSDYAGATLDRKSTTGGCQFLGNRLISWQCKKQTVVATSTTEAEYVAAASCCGQVLWIQNQLLDYGYNFMNTVIYIDNTSTICIIENPVQHSKTKHIEIRHHFIRDFNAKKLVQMAKIDTQLNVADLLTKGFDTEVCVSFIKQFWRSAEASTDENGDVKINATIDGHTLSITEGSLRRHLKLADQDGITSIPTTEIFEQLALMGYHTDSDKLTFQKGAFSPQWRFLIHNILHCLSPKKTAWEQFSSNIAAAVICLATNRKFNFSRMIFEHMVSNISSPHKFLMYPRFIQICLDMQKHHLQQHTRIYHVPTLNVPTPLTSPSRITSSPSPTPSPSPEPIPAHTPSPTQPSPTQPSPTQPSPTQPSPTQPSPTQPSPTQPSPTQPSPTQPSPTQPSPTQPITEHHPPTPHDSPLYAVHLH